MPGRSPDPLPLPPIGQLIRDRREAKIPRLSKRAAARRAGISEGYWRKAEAGQHVPAGVLAGIALVVDALPEELEAAGRPDAAGTLRMRMRRAAEAEPGLPGPLLDAARAESDAGLDDLLAEIVQGLADIDGSDRLTKAQKAELRAELIGGLVRDAADRREQVRAVLRIAVAR